MVERNVKIPKKENPVLLDKVIQDIQDTLVEKLKWLNYAFGRAYKLVEHNDDGSKFIYPAMFLYFLTIILVIFRGLIYMTHKK